MNPRSITELVITGSVAIGGSVVFVLNYLTPQINSVSVAQTIDHGVLTAAVQKIDDVDENIKLLLQYQGIKPYQSNDISTSTISGR